MGKVVTLNGNQLAEKAGNVLSLNMVMLGALIGTGATPVTERGHEEDHCGFYEKGFSRFEPEGLDLGKETAQKMMKA